MSKSLRSCDFRFPLILSSSKTVLFLVCLANNTKKAKANLENHFKGEIEISDVFLHTLKHCNLKVLYFQLENLKNITLTKYKTWLTYSYDRSKEDQLINESKFIKKYPIYFDNFYDIKINHRLKMVYNLLQYSFKLCPTISVKW